MNTVAKPFTLYGAPGSGATPVHAALTLIGVPCTTVDIAPWESEAERDKLLPVNAMRQAPVLVLPSGETMTESAAILVWLGDRLPDAGLAPVIDDPRRAQYLRWMSFVSAAIYSLYWVKDDPSRLVPDPAAQPVLVDRSEGRILDCWRMMGEQVTPGRYILGEALSVLDLYVAVVSRFRPRRRRFYEAAPSLADPVRRVDADPSLRALWAERMPFSEGWEG